MVPSGDLVGRFESVWDDEQWAMHRKAAKICRRAYDVAFNLIADRVRRHGSLMETDVQEAILHHFATNGLTTDGPPIVGVGPHSGDPHYETTPETDAPIKEGDFVLVDLWAKSSEDRGVYADYTRVGYVGEVVPAKYEDIFQVVVKARDAGIALVKEAFGAGRPLRGQEVDDAVRKVIVDAGYGPHFNHRTGHNIGQDDHGNGAHLDNLETRDDRLIIPRTCFSIEPGIYSCSEFGSPDEVGCFHRLGRKRPRHRRRTPVARIADPCVKPDFP